MKSRNNTHIKRKMLVKTVLSTVILTVIIAAIFLNLGHYSIVKNRAKRHIIVSEKSKVLSSSKKRLNSEGKQVISPTIYITGSGGNPKPVNWLVTHISPINDMPAKQGVSLSVNIKDNDKLTVTGTISKDNKYPLIEFSTVYGTIQGSVYSRALQIAIKYLESKYDIPWLNLVGYSSGGTGAIYYMIDTGGNKNYPPVKKYLSLDGEYNQLAGLRLYEQLSSVLDSGPEIETPMYQYINRNYEKIDKNTQVMLLEGDYSTLLQTDGAVPWADSFSIYHLLKNNGNGVTATLFPTKLSHGRIYQNPIVISYIKNFIYDN